MAGVFVFSAFVSTAHADFSDVSSTHSNYEAINYAQTEKIVEGYADGTFRPDQKINRAEFLKIVIGAGENQPGAGEYKNCFADVGRSGLRNMFVLPKKRPL